MMTAATFCLTVAIYYEARGEPLRGQIAVAEVILNRTKDQRWPDNVCDVVKQPGQFSFYKKGVELSPVNEKTFWGIFYTVTLPVLRRDTPEVAMGAKWFARHDVWRNWMRGKSAVKIGDHVFYSERKSYVGKEKESS